ncbi:MAG TPA: radical SAM protein [Pseudobacteroides sp.]|nr:radical SAM protein [Pseudobacteroides sp.]
MIKEIKAKTILSTVKNPSSWFGVMYNMNIYRGCEHKCIYCDSRSECYRIESFDDIEVKVNAVDLLDLELSKKRKKGTVGTGAMSDPYTPIEKQYRLTQKALKVLAENRYPVHITTKSNLILRDVDILQEINKIHASVAFTITTTDNTIAQKVEPNAPSPIERLNAMGVLSTLGICTGITMMPILPFIEDNTNNIIEIVKLAKEFGASFIYPSFGMTLRDRQRNYYYEKIERLFPGVKEKYEKSYGNYYCCNSKSVSKLKEAFFESCNKYGVSTKIPTYANKLTSIQLSLFNDKDL